MQGERDSRGLVKKARRVTNLSSFFTSQPPSTEGKYEKGVLEERKKNSPGVLISPCSLLFRGREKEIHRWTCVGMCEAYPFLST